MICFWCHLEYEGSVLSHICKDGSTFEDRANHAMENRKKEKRDTRLSISDREFLKSIKVSWDD